MSWLCVVACPSSATYDCFVIKGPWNRWWGHHCRWDVSSFPWTRTSIGVLIERTAKTGNDGYPPYNIEQTSERSYRITLAVAGFAEDDLAITVEDSTLVVRGRLTEDMGERVFLHRGIAGRQFQRSFVLAEGVEVGSATIENGLLHIDLNRSEPDRVIQTIQIRKG